MGLERMSLEGGVEVAAEIDGARKEADATVQLPDGSQYEIEYRNGKMEILLPCGTRLEGAEVDGDTIRMTVMQLPDGTRHPCDIEI